MEQLSSDTRQSVNLVKSRFMQGAGGYTGRNWLILMGEKSERAPSKSWLLDLCLGDERVLTRDKGIA